MSEHGDHGDHGEIVRYEKRGAVAVVTMNRPEYRNAQNSAMPHHIAHNEAVATNYLGGQDARSMRAASGS